MFLYEAIAFPAKSTLIEAIRKGHFATWPGLTVKRVQKYVTQNIIHDKGHMHMQRQVKSKKEDNTAKNKDNTVAEKDATETESLNPIQEHNNSKTNEYFARIEETGLCGTDQTGKFPNTSIRGYKYMFVLYNYDPNGILVRPMKN